MPLSHPQRAFFQTFGFLHLPGLLAEDIDWILREFESCVKRYSGPHHDGKRKTALGHVMAQSERFCALLDHPQLVDVAESLMGEGFNYLDGDGNLWTGDTGWHRDDWHEASLFVKFIFYLDPVGRESGCLRLIPGSHVVGSGWLPPRDPGPSVRLFGAWGNVLEELGVSPRDIPCVAVETRPGDALVWNLNLMHATFGGGPARRFFSFITCRRARTPGERKEVCDYIEARAGKISAPLMVQTASPGRMRRFEQVLEIEQEIQSALSLTKAPAPARSG